MSHARTNPGLCSLLALCCMGSIVSGGFLFSLAADSAAAEQPSILIFGLDTLRGDHLHCAGMDSLQTPYIDALAADGIYFRHCFSTAPWTLPAFASFFTGLQPYRHGAIGGNHEVLADSLNTLAEYYAAAGYATGAYVTVQYLTAKFNMMQGVDEKGHFGMSPQNNQASRVTFRGRSFLNRNQVGPFFLLLHYFDVHAPYLPPAPYDGMYYQGDERAPGEDILPFLLSDANEAEGNKAGGMYGWLDGVTDWQYPVLQYRAGVSFVDAQVGQILDHLAGNGTYDDTIVVLMSDHGEHLGEHDIYFTHTMPYHETMHVPLIIKLPGNRFAGLIIDEPVSLVDVLPTLLDLTGQAIPPDLDGRSLKPLLTGQSASDSSLLLAEKGAESDNFAKALVSWPYKLLLVRQEGRDHYSLFDLAADPGETVDISAQEPDVCLGLQVRLWEICDKDHPLLAGPGDRPAELDEAAKARLRALGY